MNTIQPYPIFRFKEISFKTDEGLEVTGEFIEITENGEDFNFIYKVNGNEFQEKVVPYSIYSRILATISLAIVDFIYDEHPVSIFLKSNSRKEDQVQDRSKHNIHGQCLKMQIYKLPEYDYREEGDGWLIYRKDL